MVKTLRENKMVTHGPTTPFYLMVKAGEFKSGRPPEDSKQEVAGLQEAIEATRKKIEEDKSNGANISDLELHLRNLKRRLEVAQNKAK